MGTENSKSGDILTVITAAHQDAEALSQVAISGAVSPIEDPSAAQGCQNGVCPVSWKPQPSAAA